MNSRGPGKNKNNIRTNEFESSKVIETLITTVSKLTVGICDRHT